MNRGSIETDNVGFGAGHGLRIYRETSGTLLTCNLHNQKELTFGERLYAAFKIALWVWRVT